MEPTRVALAQVSERAVLTLEVILTDLAQPDIALRSSSLSFRWAWQCFPANPLSLLAQTLLFSFQKTDTFKKYKSKYKKLFSYFYMVNEKK